ncbi:YIP1 family protein [Niallia sp. XMNu-256]|uniref:YIP1 family protein n=1 Tax=Niallia sp. XMNu-256 TaxID=3082444 RepID=UPI0030D093B7
MEAQENIQKPNLMKILWKPTKEMQNIRQNPIIAFPLIMITILVVLAHTLKALSISIEDIRLPGMSIQEAEMVAANTKAFTAMTGFISPVITITAATILYYIMMKIARKEVTFKQLFSMNTFISFIGAIGLLANSLLWNVIDGSQTGVMLTSLGELFNQEDILLNSIELFTIWQLIVTAIGFQIVGRLSRLTSIILVFFFFLIRISLSVLGEGLFNIFIS